MKSNSPEKENEWKPSTRSAIETALEGLSLAKKQRFLIAWSFMREETIEQTVKSAREGVVASFSKTIRMATLGDKRRGGGAAAQGRWDELLGMWVLTRGYPIKLDHQEIAEQLLNLRGKALADEYLQRANAFESNWARLEAEP